MIEQARLDEFARRLVAVDGVLAVALGGSRARGTHGPDSDVDLGVYYRPPLDVAALGELARELSDADVELTQPGGWGPWVDGGGWLRIDGVAVDWIYRDIDRVHESCSDAAAGRLQWHFQVGHPLGYPSTGYAAEVAAGVVLADPSRELTILRAALSPYPAALARSMVGSLWEAGFVIEGARKAAPRGDTAYVAGCLFRAIGLCAHALHGRAGVWVTNEKGLVQSADSLFGGFADRVDEIYALIGTDPSRALDRAERLRLDVAAFVGR